jgi:hypothetical protein
MCSLPFITLPDVIPFPVSIHALYVEQLQRCSREIHVVTRIHGPEIAELSG